MIQRIVPQSMTEPLPQKEAAEKTPETARVQNLDPNLCPICNTMLISAKANGLDVRICADHNIVMPCKDN